MYLELVTPDKKVYQGEVSIATMPGAEGSFQILNNHASMISSLSKGTLSFQDEDQFHEMTIDGGVVEILNNEIIILAESIIE
jgi:F-type H+-transporting ATPase subunit epsilon